MLKKRPKVVAFGRVRRFSGMQIRNAWQPAVAKLSAFSHPDFTVGSGIPPDRAAEVTQPLAGSTAGQDLAVITRGLTKPRRLSAL